MHQTDSAALQTPGDRWSNKMIRLYTITVALLLGQGCCSYVRDLGRVEETMDRHESAAVTDTGRVILSTRFKYEKFWKSEDSHHRADYVTKYVIISPDEILRHRRQNGDKSSFYVYMDGPVTIAPSEFALASTTPVEAVLDQAELIVTFTSDVSDVPWSHQAITNHLHIVTNGYRPRYARKWWGYPGQVLLVPAYAADAAVSLVLVPFYSIMLLIDDPN